MKIRQLLTVLLLVSLVAISGFVIFDYFSRTTVSFKLSSNVEEVRILSSKGSQKNQQSVLIEKISESKDVRLKPGEYTYMPIGSNIDQSIVNFSVGGSNLSIDVNPYFTKEHLSSLFASEELAISDVLKREHPISKVYTISKPIFYHFGEWCVITLYNNNESSGRRGADVYRAILRKYGDDWKITVSPRIVINYDNFPDIPSDIIKEVNNL